MVYWRTAASRQATTRRCRRRRINGSKRLHGRSDYATMPVHRQCHNQRINAMRFRDQIGLRKMPTIDVGLIVHAPQYRTRHGSRHNCASKFANRQLSRQNTHRVSWRWSVRWSSSRLTQRFPAASATISFRTALQLAKFTPGARSAMRSSVPISTARRYRAQPQSGRRFQPAPAMVDVNNDAANLSGEVTPILTTRSASARHCEPA